MTETTENPADDDRLTTMGLLIEAYTGLAAKVAPQLDEHGLSLPSSTCCSGSPARRGDASG